MSNKRTKLITLIAILAIIGGIWSTLTSLPLYSLYSSIKQGKVSVNNKVSVMQVQPNSPAEEVQLKQGDTIISVNGEAVSNPQDFIDISDANASRKINIVFERDGNMQTVQVIPRVNTRPGQGKVGLVLSGSGFERKPVHEIIPQIILRSYAGYEEKPFFFFYTQAYQDKTYSRLQALILGIINVFVGVGLLRMKKWAAYGFLGLIAYGLVVSAIYLLNISLFQSNAIQYSLFERSNIRKAIDLAVIIIGWAMELFFAYYLFKNKNRFTK